jgi:membrane protein implicated in regulation of membrane protease activity
VTIIYIVALISGLLLAVRAMLFGVERGRRFGDAAPPRVRMSPAIAAAFATAFGVAGYLASRPGRLEPSAALLLAIAAGLAGAGLGLWVVRRAQAFVPDHDPDDPRYLLQGHVATVLQPIDANSAGEISYVVDGERYVATAVGIDGSTAAAGTEVVIERIEDGVAHVEPWSAIEQRI